MSFDGTHGFQSPFPSVCAICTTFANGTQAIVAGEYIFVVGVGSAAEVITKTIQLTGDAVVVNHGLQRIQRSL